MFFNIIPEASGESLFDYYPNLGTKSIVIRGEDANKEPLNGGKVKAELIYPPPGWDISKEKITLTPEADMVQGRAEIKLTVQPEVTPNDLESIELKFTYIVNDVDNGSLSGTWTVRNNSNVKMREVLAGEAVFVFDDNNGDNHKGITPANVTDDNERYFDFVQELLNQVVPRKRLTTYELLEENGIFDTTIEINIGKFKHSAYFNVDNTSGQAWDFRKLMKDYNKTNHSTWENRIVDTRLLVGSEQRATDNLINGISGNIVNDTGLYELYVNVVKAFVREMIEYGQTYVDDTTAFKSRTGSDEHGVSYCYGCNDNLGEYQGDVSNVVFAPTPVPANYRGDTAPTDPGKKYAGLYQNEKENYWDPHFNTAACNQITEHRFYPQHWAGIDCSGFVQRIINHADVTVTPTSPILGVNTKVWNLDGYRIVCNASGRYLDKRSWNSYFFDETYDIAKHISFTGLTQQQKDEKLKLLKKGDLIHYSGHITTVYSERVALVGTQPRYRIIHAYGTPEADINDDNVADEFARKVVISPNRVLLPNNTYGLTNPLGIGRIKLWD